MSEKRIREGDIVNVYWSDDTILCRVRVIWTPCDVGDLWQFEEADGTVHAVNPMSSEFLSIVRKEDVQHGPTP